VCKNRTIIFSSLLDIRENVLLDIHENVYWPHFLAHPIDSLLLLDIHENVYWPHFLAHPIDSLLLLPEIMVRSMARGPIVAL